MAMLNNQRVIFGDHWVSPGPVYPTCQQPFQGGVGHLRQLPPESGRTKNIWGVPTKGRDIYIYMWIYVNICEYMYMYVHMYMYIMYIRIYIYIYYYIISYIMYSM